MVIYSCRCWILPHTANPSLFRIFRFCGQPFTFQYEGLPISSSHGNFSIDIYWEQISWEGGLPFKLLYVGQRQIMPHTAMTLRYGHQDAITVIVQLAMTSKASMETTNTACGASKHVTKLPGRQPQNIELTTVSVLWLLMRWTCSGASCWFFGHVQGTEFNCI